MAHNRKGLALKTEYGQLKTEFTRVTQQRMSVPFNDAIQQKAIHIKTNYDRLYKEMAAHRTETKPAMWNEMYFRTEVQLLSNWLSLMIRQFTELRDAGVDTEELLKGSEAFRAKVIDVISKREMVDNITNALCDFICIE